MEIRLATIVVASCRQTLDNNTIYNLSWNKFLCTQEKLLFAAKMILLFADHYEFTLLDYTQMLPLQLYQQTSQKTQTILTTQNCNSHKYSLKINYYNDNFIGFVNENLIYILDTGHCFGGNKPFIQ